MSETIDLDDLRDELLTLGAATLYEASGWDIFLPATIRPAWPGARMVGRAFPVRAAAGDNLPLHHALEQARPGDVLVVDAADAPHGYWGEVLTNAAQHRGIVGLVISGGVRDIDRLEDLAFPAFSSWIALEGTLKNNIGTVGETIHIGKATIDRGDVVVADRDGVAVIPSSRFTEVLELARSRAIKETRYIERIRAGELTLDLYNLRSPTDFGMSRKE